MAVPRANINEDALNGAKHGVEQASQHLYDIFTNDPGQWSLKSDPAACCERDFRKGVGKRIPKTLNPDDENTLHDTFKGAFRTYSWWLGRPGPKTSSNRLSYNRPQNRDYKKDRTLCLLDQGRTPQVIVQRGEKGVYSNPRALLQRRRAYTFLT